MKAFINIFTCLLFFSSCSTKNIFGTYAIHRPDDEIKITLDSNHRFNYVKWEGLAKWYTSGTWVFNGDAVFFTSDKGLTSRNGNVVEINNPDLNFNRIRVFDFPDSVLAKDAIITINDSIKKVVDSSGMIDINVPVKQFHIKNFKYEFFYETKNTFSNVFKVYLLPRNNSEIFFSNKRYELKGKKLISSDGDILKKE